MRLPVNSHDQREIARPRMADGCRPCPAGPARRPSRSRTRWRLDGRPGRRARGKVVLVLWARILPSRPPRVQRRRRGSVVSGRGARPDAVAPASGGRAAAQIEQRRWQEAARRPIPRFPICDVPLSPGRLVTTTMSAPVNDADAGAGLASLRGQPKPRDVGACLRSCHLGLTP